MPSKAAVLDSRKSLKRSRAALPYSPPVSHSRQESDGSPLPLQDFGPPTSDISSTSRPLFTRPLGQLVEKKGDVPETVYFGPTSLEALLDFEDSISGRITSEIHGYRETDESIHDRINAFINSGHTNYGNSVPSPPTEPPLAILQAMIEPYFANINPHFPMWTKTGFQKIVASLRQHSVSPEIEWASIVCCNNLILMNLTADSMRSVQQKMAQSRSSENVPLVDSDLIAGFLANSKRAIENLGLLSPRLINLQALLSSCVVAQEHFPPHLLGFVFAQAAHCAETIGVLQWHRLQNQLVDGELQEYKNIAHCLYILDKQISWTVGASPKILRSEVYLDLTPADACFKPLAMRTELAAIEEIIFFQVYAGHVKPRTEEQVRDVVGPIVQRLNDWLGRSGVDAEEATRQPESCSPAHAATVFSYLCVKLLLTWPYREHPDAMFQQRYGSAVACVRLLTALWAARPDAGQPHVSVPQYVVSHLGARAIVGNLLTFFASLITSWPPLYLLEVCAGIINDNGSNGDRECVRRFFNLLKAIVGNRQETFYTKRLREVVSILMDTVADTGTATKRRRTMSSMDYMSRPSSNYSAFQGQTRPGQAGIFNSGRDYVYTGSLGPEQRYYTAGGLASDWYDSTKIITPNHSRDGDIRLSSAHELIGLEEVYGEELFSNLGFLGQV
ncbi:hypothetical protein DV737_g1956, partial [Chaetothyriales sp. CBS 132003]